MFIELYKAIEIYAYLQHCGLNEYQRFWLNRSNLVQNSLHENFSMLLIFMRLEFIEQYLLLVDIYNTEYTYDTKLFI
jgi:hypothetical protein